MRFRDCGCPANSRGLREQQTSGNLHLCAADSCVGASRPDHPVEIVDFDRIEIHKPNRLDAGGCEPLGHVEPYASQSHDKHPRAGEVSLDQLPPGAYCPSLRLGGKGCGAATRIEGLHKLVTDDPDRFRFKTLGTEIQNLADHAPLSPARVMPTTGSFVTAPATPE